MRVLLTSLLLLIAGALAPAAHAQKTLPGLTEGVHYRYVEQGRPYAALAPGMVEVAEIFAYTCPHCADFAPLLDKWKQSLPKHARLVLVPGVFGRDDAYARVFFASQTAKAHSVLHPRLFTAIHERNELPRNATTEQIQAYAGRIQGVNAKALATALADDDTLLPKLRHAYEFAQRSQIEGTPALVVAGRYLILGNSYDSLLANARAVVDALAPKKPASKAAQKPAAVPSRS